MKKATKVVLAIHVWIIAAIIPLLVRILSLKRILEIFTPSHLFRPYRGISSEELTSVVNDRLKHPVCMVKRACLRKGLMMFHFFRLAGLEATLHISVYPRSVSGRFLAHCWVTSYGKTVSSPADPDTAPLFSYSAGS